MPAIKFRKYFFRDSDFDRPAGEIWLLQIYFVEVRNMLAESSEPNKLQNVYVGDPIKNGTF